MRKLYNQGVSGIWAVIIIIALAIVIGYLIAK